jgi:hypothetical protein
MNLSLSGVIALYAFLSPAALLARPCLPDRSAFEVIGSGPVQDARVTFFTAGLMRDVDPRLAIAIAGHESSFGRFGDCATRHNNAWGYGGGWPSCRPFDDFAAGVEEVTRSLREFYFDEGFNTIAKINERWCPYPEGGSNCHESVWTFGVTYFYRTVLGGFTHDLTYASGCCGDCNANAEVAVNELVFLVDIALGFLDSLGRPLTGPCPRGDGDDDGLILITDLLKAVGSALPPEDLSECPAA